MLASACTPDPPDGPPTPPDEAPLPVAVDDTAAAARHVYVSHGVHNDAGCTPPEACIAQRGPDDPTDPEYPEYWSSDWTMYIVRSGYEANPPPYANPPARLTPADYVVSTGSTFYDDAYRPPGGDGTGAMMEYYQDTCLPIFPSANGYTCAFVSLGNKAWFFRYAEGATGPASEVASCCQFSLENHPPRRDFVKHLPYDAQRSTHLGGSVQAYAYLAPTDHGPILFGYAFEREPRPDAADPSLVYRHPQSFYFSGFPGPPVDAPIVSQNYTDFRAERPDPAQTWDRVGASCQTEVPWCCLFSGDCPTDALEAAPPPEWSELTPPGS